MCCWPIYPAGVATPRHAIAAASLTDASSRDPDAGGGRILKANVTGFSTWKKDPESSSRLLPLPVGAAAMFRIGA